MDEHSGATTAHGTVAVGVGSIPGNLGTRTTTRNGAPHMPRMPVVEGGRMRDELARTHANEAATTNAHKTQHQPPPPPPEHCHGTDVKASHNRQTPYQPTTPDDTHKKNRAGPAPPGTTAVVERGLRQTRARTTTDATDRRNRA